MTNKTVDFFLTGTVDVPGYFDDLEVEIRMEDEEAIMQSKPIFVENHFTIKKPEYPPIILYFMSQIKLCDFHISPTKRLRLRLHPIPPTNGQFSRLPNPIHPNERPCYFRLRMLPKQSRNHSTPRMLLRKRPSNPRSTRP